MAYNQVLAGRVRNHLDPTMLWTEKKMFGGIGFLFQGNMAFGIHKDNLLVRVGKEQFSEMLFRPHVSKMDLNNRPMTGWVSVSLAGLETEEDLKNWLDLGFEQAKLLPPK